MRVGYCAEGCAEQLLPQGLSSGGGGSYSTLWRKQQAEQDFYVHKIELCST
jgi:hypothetical protein